MINRGGSIGAPHRALLKCCPQFTRERCEEGFQQGLSGQHAVCGQASPTSVTACSSLVVASKAVQPGVRVRTHWKPQPSWVVQAHLPWQARRWARPYPPPHTRQRAPPAESAQLVCPPCHRRTRPPLSEYCSFGGACSALTRTALLSNCLLECKEQRRRVPSL